MTAWGGRANGLAASVNALSDSNRPVKSDRNLVATSPYVAGKLVLRRLLVRTSKSMIDLTIEANTFYRTHVTRTTTHCLFLFLFVPFFDL